MNCKEVENGAIPYLDGKLARRQREAVELHLETCSSCRERVQGFSEVFGLLDEWKSIETSAFFNSRLARRIEQEVASTGWWEAFWGWLTSLPLSNPTLALAMLAVVSLGIVLVGYSPAPTDTLARQESAPVVASLPGGVDEVALYRELPVLEDLDVLRNFEVLQELNNTHP